MPRRQRSSTASTVLLISVLFGLASCGGGEPEPDNAAIDHTLNQLIADDEAQQRRLVEEARAREEIRENEMEKREENYTETPD